MFPDKSRAGGLWPKLATERAKACGAFPTKKARKMTLAESTPKKKIRGCDENTYKERCEMGGFERWAGVSESESDE